MQVITFVIRLIFMIRSIIHTLFLILSAVLFSTIGVFAGLLIFQKPFGIIMSGIGVIALAGIVVRNSLILVEFITQERERGGAIKDALLRAGAIRMRPILLTAGTTLLGNLVITLDPVFSGLALAIAPAGGNLLLHSLPGLGGGGHERAA